MLINTLFLLIFTPKVFIKIQTPYRIELRSSPIHGLGVFAIEKIKSGEIIEICPVIDMGIPKGESTHILIDYRFNWPQGMEWEKQVVATGFAMMYNHSDTPNASWRSNLDLNSFEFYAVKDIEIDEEIFVWYGNVDYWNDGRLNTKVI